MTTGQAQIYQKLKKLYADGMAELKEQTKDDTVDRKVYAITDIGRAVNLLQLQMNTIDDFISRDAFLMQLFFSGALSGEELAAFIETQLRNVSELEQRLIDNYNDNYEKFLAATGMDEGDSRLRSAVWAHKWGLIKCREYVKLLREIKTQI